MIYLLCSNITQRHRYTFNLVFNRWLNAEYQIITSADDYEPGKGALIVYNNTHRQSGIFIPSSGILDETAIRNLIPEYGTYLSKPILFPAVENHSTLPYDIFSAIFYMVSRYEEYMPYTPDKHGRFEVSMSYAGIRGVQHVPVVDYWLMQLREVIEQFYPGEIAKQEPYTFLPTYDIDQFWCYRHKGFLRNSAGFMRDLFKGKTREAGIRLRVIFSSEKDPFDSYEYQDSLHQKYALKPIYFIHPGTYGTFDKNIPLHKHAVVKMVQALAKKYTIGLHPSYCSAENPDLLQQEIKAFSDLTGTPVSCCRQHFLRIHIPDTYRNYLACGITHDYSLGWASDNGFRAGTGRSFPFYDLKKEQETALILHPLTMMDGAFKNYKKQSAKEAMQEAESMINALKETGSSCISLWHNESLGSSKRWAGWKEVYEFILEKAR